MELFSKSENRDRNMKKNPSLNDEERLAQQQFAQSIPVIERDKRPGSPTASSEKA